MVMFDNVKIRGSAYSCTTIRRCPGRSISRPRRIHTAIIIPTSVLLVKLQMLAGLASRIATGQWSGPSTGRPRNVGASRRAGGIARSNVAGQIHAAEEWPAPGYVTFNRRMMYAALNWGVENYSAVIDTLRELCGGGVLQMPSDISVLQNEALAKEFQNPLANATDERSRPHEAVQTRLEYRRLGAGGPSPAIRKILSPAPLLSSATTTTAKRPGPNGKPPSTRFSIACKRLAASAFHARNR